MLVSLTGFVLLTDFKTKNKFPELLPQSSMFWSHPISFVKQYFAVYKLHSDAYMAEQQEKRARNLDEARKRKEYLIAHGIEKEGIFGFGTIEGDARKEKRRRESQALGEERLREEYNEDLKAGTGLQGLDDQQMQSNGQNGVSQGNHALQDYQNQLVQLEQQNKKRLSMALQEHESSQSGAFLGNDGKMLTSGVQDVKEPGEETRKTKKWFGIW